MNYYEHHIGDYAAATGHLTLIEDAIYSRLIRRYYLDEKPLPVDAKKVARLAGARSEEEIAAVNSVLEEFFTLEADGWHNSRCDEEIEKSNKKRAALRDLQNREAYRQHREFILSRDGYACVYCGDMSGPFHLDHILPRSRGGSDAPTNLATACRPCNLSKGNKLLSEWIR